MSWNDWQAVENGRSRSILDVRSPSEFQDDHAPGAHSMPLVNDDQRHVVGLLYAKKGPEMAFQKAGEFVRQRLNLYKEQLPVTLFSSSDQLESAFAEIYALVSNGQLTHNTRDWAYDTEHWDKDLRAGTPPIFVYCWRGGLRSRTFALLLNQLGLRAVQLIGGYKSFRRQVIDEIAALQVPPTIVVHGMTGTGKTELLGRLVKSFPDSVLDLEGLAGHRSSILGDVGLKPVSTRTFESTLLQWFREHKSSRLIVEGESRKIGGVPIPKALWEAMNSGIRVNLSCQESARARRLVAEYVRPERSAAIRERLDFLQARLPDKVGKRLLSAYDAEDYEDVATLLLKHYYDPRYGHSQKGNEYVAGFDSTDMSQAETDFKKWFHELGDNDH
jgi:tRNA 2-selenouridine synthase